MTERSDMKLSGGKLLIFAAFLVLLDISWHAWSWMAGPGIQASTKRFKIVEFHTNDVSGVGVVDMQTGSPLWIEWLGRSRTPSELNYFFRGTNILNVYLNNSDGPLYKFIFHGPQKREEWWMNIGGCPSFTGRVTYDTNGERSAFEVWYGQRWRSVERRDGHNGFILDGQWHQLAVGENGLTIKEVSPRN